MKKSRYNSDASQADANAHLNYSNHFVMQPAASSHPREMSGIIDAWKVPAVFIMQLFASAARGAGIYYPGRISMGVEIERKFTVKKLPDNIESYPFHVIEQAYLNVSPAIRVRREDDTYYMTYKAKRSENTGFEARFKDAEHPSAGAEESFENVNHTDNVSDSAENANNAGDSLDNVTRVDKKSAGTSVQQIGQTEYNLPLDAESYEHLSSKADGNVIRKKRYLIPLNEDAFSPEAAEAHPEIKKALENGSMKIELDVFEAPFEGRILAEVEFPSEEAASLYRRAEWFDEDVTGDIRYSNAHMSRETLQHA